MTADKEIDTALDSELSMIEPNIGMNPILITNGANKIAAPTHTEILLQN
jgi:hypothetical protein